MAGFIRLLRRSGTTYQTRRQWGARYRASLNRFYPPGEYLFLHISVTHKTGSHATRMRVIERIGVERFTRTHFSYNDVVFEDGSIYQGQPRRRKGAHTINDKNVPGYPHDLNAHGHALVLPQMPDDPVTEAQIDSAARWAAAMVLSGRSTADEILPHRMFAYKDCPSDPAVAALPEINRRFRRYVKRGLRKPRRINMTHLQAAYNRPRGRVFNPWGRRANRVWHKALKDDHLSGPRWNWTRAWFDKHLRASTRHANIEYGLTAWTGKNRDRPTWALAELLGLDPHWAKRRKRRK